MQQNLTEQNTDWLATELEQLNNNAQLGEQLPSLKFEQENKIEEINIEFPKEGSFSEWTDVERKITKKKIPCYHNGIKKMWWLNRNNPAYREILKAFKEKGTTAFKIMRTGAAEKTKYIIVL